ncbi:MAG: hypothetical protein KatS3mg131_1600 [Candidatus Tectimicrobiota bacterium]|nr:MAG: hypothetical protein KatS3mg131_1600 [Candidatus Tectomicrobia bacterium]
MAASPWKPYFAYGSNMDVAQMRYRCPGARVIGIGVLPRHRFIINRRGVASVVPAAACDVHGVLWHITPAHEAALDDYEGVAEGCYYKTTVDIVIPGQERVAALIYIATENTPGVPRPRYMERILLAATAHGLPEAYCAKLRAWLPRP